MKPNLVQKASLAAALVLALAAGELRAQFIQPIAVFASNGQASQDTLINGNGFDTPGLGSPGSIHNQDSAEVWSAIGTIKAELVFDLGQTVSLTQVYIWNYNVAGGTDIGMKDVEIQVSEDSDMTNANFTAISQIALAEGGSTGQVFNVVGTDVRLVKLKALSNWGQGFTVGLAEVRFGAGSIIGHVPSVLINKPKEGDIVNFATNAAVTLDATVTDLDSDLLKVEFLDGTNKLGEKAVAPFTLVVTAPSIGVHAFRFVATDRSGKISWQTVNVTVREFVADRIIQIDDTADEGSDTNQIKYTGAWNLAQGDPGDPRFNHNDHYESNNTKSDYFEVRFVGVKIDIYSTVASHHGTGRVSIDGGAESVVSYYAAVRAEQVHVWSSPLLPQREHVMRVRVAGDGVVTADRFDVSVSDKPVDRAVIQNVDATFTNVVVTMEDVGLSVVVPASANLFLDGLPVVASVVKTGSATILSNQVNTPFSPGSTHSVTVIAKDTNNQNLTNSASFTLPAPVFPLTGPGGPGSIAGNWGLRQIWNVDNEHIYDLASAVQKVLKANQAGFSGDLQDTNVPTINFSFGGAAVGLFPTDVPLPAESSGLPTDDFLVVAQADVVIPANGDWTIGVHTDEGFALRFVGAPFASVSGTGSRDDNFPEYMVSPNLTTDSSTRGVISNLTAGHYQIQFISWQRTGAASFEIYAAPGAYENDLDTDQWQLIGDVNGLQMIPGTPLTIHQLARSSNGVTIEFDTPQPDKQHQLFESLDLRSWQAVSGAVFTKIGSNRVQISVTGVPGLARFYKVALPN